MVFITNCNTPPPPLADGYDRGDLIAKNKSAMGQKLLSLRLSISCLRLEVIQLAPSAILFMAYLTAYDPASFLELKF